MVEVDHLSKVYGGRVSVWKVSFRVAKGEILGFLGPNGAGKTTTMRMITGFIPPSSGTAKVDGIDVAENPIAAKARVGYLCETPPLYREMSVRGYLKFVSEIKRVPRSRRRASVERAVELCGLSDVADRVIGHLSKGYRQRVGLAQAILHEPPVLILDEPTVGLDPAQIIEIRRLIRDLGGEQTVILSTHILPEVTATRSRVVIIHEGQVVAEDRIENLTDDLNAGQGVRLRVARPVAGLDSRLRAVPGVQDVRASGELVFDLRMAAGDGPREGVVAEAVASGAGVVELSPQAASLEHVFMRLVTRETAGATA